MITNIFTSYSSQNRPLVEILTGDLDALGYEVWFDRDLTGGSEWWATILANIRRCDLFIFALTMEWLKSVPSRLEFEYAVSLNRPMMPVMVGNVNVRVLPSAIQKLQIIDYTRQDKEQLITLVKAIHSAPPAVSLPDPLPPEPAVPLSPFATLRDRVEAPALDPNEQHMLVNEFKALMASAEMFSDARDWLLAMRQRRDLTPEISNEIAALLQMPRPDQ